MLSLLCCFSLPAVFEECKQLSVESSSYPGSTTGWLIVRSLLFTFRLCYPTLPQPVFFLTQPVFCLYRVSHFSSTLQPSLSPLLSWLQFSLFFSPGPFKPPLPACLMVSWRSSNSFAILYHLPGFCIVSFLLKVVSTYSLSYLLQQHCLSETFC